MSVIHCLFQFTDTEKPRLPGTLAPIFQNTDSGSPTAIVTWTELSQNSDNSGIFTLTQTHYPGDAFPIGVTTVWYTATDPSGNMRTRSLDITITG